jgi:hypothetical protein
MKTNFIKRSILPCKIPKIPIGLAGSSKTHERLRPYLHEGIYILNGKQLTRYPLEKRKLSYSVNTTSCRVKFNCRTPKFNFRGHEKPKIAKGDFFYEILIYRPILTIDIMFHTGTRPPSEPQKSRSTRIDRGRSTPRGSKFFKMPNKGKCAVAFLYVNARYAKTANISGKEYFF